MKIVIVLKVNIMMMFNNIHFLSYHINDFISCNCYTRMYILIIIIIMQ